MKKFADQVIKKAIPIVGDILKDENPPQNIKEALALVEKIWKRDIMPEATKFSGMVKKEFEPVGKAMKDFFDGAKHGVNEATGFFKDQVEQLKKSSSPILKKFGDFLKSAGDLIAGVAKSGKDLATKTWSEFKDNANKAVSVVKNAAKGMSAQR